MRSPSSLAVQSPILFNDCSVNDSDSRRRGYIFSLIRITGNKLNALRGEYEIEVDRHDDFFDAYLAALACAVGEGVVSNPKLVETIDRLYEATITEDISL